jgi:hypothetical protein
VLLHLARPTSQDSPFSAKHNLPNCMRTTLLRQSKLIPLVHKRTMSSKPQFLAIVHDFPNTIQKRVEIRSEHLSAVSKNLAVRAGGIPQTTIRRTVTDVLRCILFQGSDTGGSTSFCGESSGIAKTNCREV